MGKKKGRLFGGRPGRPWRARSPTRGDLETQVGSQGEMISRYQGNANLGQDFEERSKEDEFCTELKVQVKNLDGS